MVKNDFYQLIITICMCLTLFFLFDAVSVLFASIIVYLEMNTFSFCWRDVFTSFSTTGYIGGVILGIGLWIKGILQKKRGKNHEENTL